jgi:hypothetical protein
MELGVGNFSADGSGSGSGGKSGSHGKGSDAAGSIWGGKRLKQRR